MGNLLLCANGYCCGQSHSQIRSLSHSRLLVRYNGKFDSVAPIRGDWLGFKINYGDVVY